MQFSRDFLPPSFRLADQFQMRVEVSTFERHPFCIMEYQLYTQNAAIAFAVHFDTRSCFATCNFRRPLSIPWCTYTGIDSLQATHTQHPQFSYISDVKVTSPLASSTRRKSSAKDGTRKLFLRATAKFQAPLHGAVGRGCPQSTVKQLPAQPWIP